ncbi:MAG TPA: hypothetical protein VIT42_00650 [Microlunatus sp.]
MKAEVGPMHVEQLGGEQWADLRALRLAALADEPAAFWATLAEEAAFDESRWRPGAGRRRAGCG